MCGLLYSREIIYVKHFSRWHIVGALYMVGVIITHDIVSSLRAEPCLSDPIACGAPPSQAFSSSTFWNGNASVH